MSHHRIAMSSPALLPIRVVAAAAVLALGSSAIAGTISPVPETHDNQSALASWWHGDGLTGNWFGLRDELADYGLTFTGRYYGAFFGVIDSEGGSRGFWDEGIEFGAEHNYGKLLKIEALEGVKGFANFRYRDSWADSNPNSVVEASSMFSPTNWQSGTQFRVMSFGLEIGTANLLPVKDMIVLRGGWLQPQREFIDQPLSKLFLNNAVNSAKGIGGNIPFSSSFSTWGGTLRVKPVEWHYVKAGLFMAYPEATATGNHGLAFQGYAQDPSQNGLMAMLETGFTPKIGPSELPGRYAAGAYYWGNERNSFFGAEQYGQYGFYAQADQMLYREPSAVVTTSHSGDGKSFKEPVAAETSLSKQGLSMFNLVTFAPKYNNPFPFYFHSGLVYTGLIPGRDADQTMFSVAYGSYSFYNIENLQDNGVVNQPNYTIFLEGAYRIVLNRWAYVQPFVQYIVQPNGTNNVENATILGVATGLTF